MSSSFLLHHTLMRVVVPQRSHLLALVKSREGWGAERIRDWQEARLREMIAYCWENVPFYRKHWKGHLDDPRDINTLTDLQRLPVVTRQMFRDHVAEMITTDTSVEHAEARTGGSTASPIVYRTTKHDDEYAWAQLYQGWTWAGWRMGDPFLVVGGESVGAGLGDRLGPGNGHARHARGGSHGIRLDEITPRQFHFRSPCSCGTARRSCAGTEISISGSDSVWW
jgi:phenylacetate-CoA ligase